MALAIGLSLAACTAPRPDGEGRGGPKIVRRSTVEVAFGWPGTWEWRLEVAPGGAFVWSLATAGEEQTLAFDGRAASYRLGGAELARDETPAEVLSVARFLMASCAGVLPLPASVRREPSRDPRRERLVFAEGASWDIVRDRRGRVVETRGPIRLPTVGSGQLVARFSDFRPVDGVELPFAIELAIDGRPFAREEVIDHRPEGRIRPIPASVHPELGASGG